MTSFLWNVFLAVIWAFSLGEFSLTNLIVGLILGYAILWLSADLIGARRYCSKVPRILEFIAFFLWELLRANIRFAYDVVTPRFHMRPGIIALPLDAKSDGEITLLASLISLTPGSLSLDVSADRKKLYIHMQFISDLDQEKQRLKRGFERRLLNVLR